MTTKNAIDYIIDRIKQETLVISHNRLIEAYSSIKNKINDKKLPSGLNSSSPSMKNNYSLRLLEIKSLSDGLINPSILCKVENGKRIFSKSCAFDFYSSVYDCRCLNSKYGLHIA